MVNFEEELKIYRAVSSISGDILFKYDSKTDVMHVLGGHKSNAGNGYDLPNFLKGMDSNGADALLKHISSRFVAAYKKGFPEFFDEKISVQTKSGGECIYRAIGKKEYDDDWNEVGIIGKLINLGEIAATEKFVENIQNSAEFTIKKKESETETVFNDSEAQKKGKLNSAELIEEALDILASTGNIGTAVNTILQKIGDKYDLDCVTIQEFDDKSDVSFPCIQWYDENNRAVCDKIARVPFDNFPKYTWEGNSELVVDDVENYIGDNLIINKMKDIEVKSVIICKYSDKKRDMGWISFENHRKACKWTYEEIVTFRLVAKFISVYLLDMKSYLELLKKEEREITHDAITDLPKYELFMDRAIKYINFKKEDELAIICFGLNNLEKINSIYGRVMGDQILKIFAEECAKIKDRFITGCRVNANNFVALVNQFDSRGNKISAAMIEHMNSTFENICKEKCPEAGVVVYSGISFLPDHVERLDNYVSKARQAMENARDEGITCGFAY